MSKKLPKAIGQTIDDLRRTKPDTRDESKTARVSLASIPSPVAGVRPGDVLAEEVRHRRGSAEPLVPVARVEKPAIVEPPQAVPVASIPVAKPPVAVAVPAVTIPEEKADKPAPETQVQETSTQEMPTQETQIVAPTQGKLAEKLPQQSPVVKPTPDDRDAELHRARAREIVERHATYSAVGGFIPLPLVELVSMTAIVHRMVKNLAEHYEVPFDRDRTRALIAGVLGGLAPLGLGALTTASLVKLIPGANLIGLGVSSMAAAEGTRRIGYIFMAHFEGGGTLLDFRHKPE